MNSRRRILDDIKSNSSVALGKCNKHADRQKLGSRALHLAVMREAAGELDRPENTTRGERSASSGALPQNWAAGAPADQETVGFDVSWRREKLGIRSKPVLG
jgi:hypothetical protein